METSTNSPKNNSFNFHVNQSHPPECVTNKHGCLQCSNVQKRTSITCGDIEEVDCRRMNSNRVDLNKSNLCLCSHSHTFPLCDGTHLTQKSKKTTSEILLIEKKQSKQTQPLEPSICNVKLSQTKTKAFLKVDKTKITSVFSKEEVANHSTREDCWMIIKGHVYDITPYFEYHPGGTKALLNFAGKDGTSNVEFHSSQMMFLLDSYFYIGRLEGTKETSCVIS